MSQLDSIAVVGASALFANSNGAAPFWTNILEGRDLMSDVPADHWLISDYYDPNPALPGKVYAKRGGFLPKVDFDPMHWGMPPKQLSSTDTAQLLALIVAGKVLDDAASVQFGKVDRKQISVILGVASATELVGQMAAKIQRPHWVKALRDANVPESEVEDICRRIEATYPEWDESTFPGLLGNVVAGRIANRFDLGGTNCVIDAACASSLGAVAMAVQELQLGHSDLVITGGVDAINDIFMYMCFSKTPALSPSGDCRPFSDQADGTMLGEGIGMLALRRLADAERDGDKIYAVIRGVGASSDGRAKSIYAPRAEGQEIAIQRAYQHAGYSAGEVELIEAHGTATKAGDAAEFEGLQRAFSGLERPDRQWCALGSVKSQIGHTKAAAGSASLFKIVMALHHKVLPPTIKVDKPNGAMAIEDSPFYLNTQRRPWIHRPGSTRKGSVSSFGFGGSNFHLALEEYTGKASSALRFANPAIHLLLLAANSAAALLELAGALNATLDAASLAWRARESQLRFDAALPYRLAVMGADETAARANLEAAIRAISSQAEQPFSLPARVHFGIGTQVPKVAFLFPGQGSQYVNMGADLAMEYQSVRQAWDEAAALDPSPEQPLHRTVFPIPCFTDAERAGQAASLTRTDRAQPAIGATSMAMLRLLKQVGVAPAAVAGHSFGEVSALHAAGAIADGSTLLAIAHKRGELMHQAAALPGAMTAVLDTASAVQARLDKDGDCGVTIANFNSPKQTVVAGPTDAVERFEEQLRTAQIAFRRLPVATAFHTSLVADCAAPFGRYLADAPVSAPGVVVYANATAAPYPGEADAIRQTLARQLAEPVRFEQMIQRMHQDGIDLFVEVGPGSTLTGLVGDCLGQQQHVAVALDNRKTDGRCALFNALAVLAVNGLKVDFAALWQEFAAFPAPQDAAKLSPASVKLNGGNYGKPYPPANGAAGVPMPNPERVAAVAPQAASQPAAPEARAPRPAPVASQAAAPAPAASQAAPPPAAVDPAWAATFEAMQRSMLEAQQSFSRTLSESHMAFLRVSETAFSQLGQMAHGGHAPDAAGVAPAVAPTALLVTAPVSAPPVSAQVAAPIPASAVAPLPPDRAVTARPAPTSSAAGLQAILLGVVAEQTGYPVEMLTPDMEMEAGLGIDSIKRVEIMSILQEKLPQLASVDPARLATLSTLAEIIAFAGEAAPADGGITAVSAVAPAAAHAGGDFEHILLGVVAEKTGYPVEMLTLDMELESGLGIDSIKRVEILSQLQETIPQLHNADPARLASLATLADIVAYASTATAPGALSPAPAPYPAPLSDSADFTAILLAVVADKTGYPVEMLTLDMELESGLGIDSIKRVEILSQLQEKVPQLEAADPARMAALATLADIVAFAAHAAPPAPAAPIPPKPPAVAAQPQPPHAGGSEDLQAILLAVVADKTGYPIEMLTLDMELEGGLGIDSIKRVEILSALQEKLPHLAEADPARMASLATLGEIVDFAGGASHAAGDGDGAGAAPPAPSPGGLLTRQVVSIMDSPPSGLVTPGLNRLVPLYLVADQGGVALLLAEHLRNAGLSAQVVDTPPAEARAVILLCGLDQPQASAASLASLNATVFRHLRACAARMAKDGVLLVTVQDTGGDFGIGGASGERAWSAGIGAAAKTASLEWPTAAVKAIDIDTGADDAHGVAARLFAELMSGGAQREVGLRRDLTRVAPVALPEPQSERLHPVRGDDVIVVSGGARGVAAQCLRELLARAPARVAILGRSGLEEEDPAWSGIDDDSKLKALLLEQSKRAGTVISPRELGARVRRIFDQREMRANLAQFTALGATVEYHAVDVGDSGAVATAIDRIRASLGPVTALVHAAGVLADKEIALKTDAQFDTVWRTKVDGFANLLAATAPDPLRHIVVFSSIAARNGNIGQIDYAMANEVLNRVCRAERVQRGPSCLVKAIGWGPWAGGMVDAGLARHFGAMGIALIGLQDGARLFADEMTGMNGDAVEIIYGGGMELFGGPARPAASTSDLWFHRSQQAYLSSHVIRTLPVVPLVAVNELALQGVAALYPGDIVARTAKLQVVKGIELAHFDGGGDWYQLRCGAREGDTVPVQIVDGNEIVRYSLEVLIGTGAEEDVADIAAPAPGTWQRPLDRIYPEALFHGPQLQVIAALTGWSDNGCAGTLVPCGAAMAGAGAGLDILDGGLQLAVLWMYQKLGYKSLPTALGRFQRYGWAPGEAVHCVLRCENLGSLMATWTIHYRSGAGALLASMTGLKVHFLPAAADDAQASGAPGASLDKSGAV